MSTVKTLLMSRSFYAIALSVIISVAFVAVAVNGATTISTNITTGGSLSVSGASTFTGNVQANGQLYATSSLAVTAETNLFATTTLKGEAPLVLGQSTVDLTGQVEGTLFYDSTSKLLRLYDGNAWFSVATTTGGFTVSGTRIQQSNVATEYVAIGTSTLNTAGSVLTILQATSTDSIPLGIFTTKGGGQTTAALAVYDQTETAVFTINSAGQVSSNLSVGGLATTTAASGNFATAGDVTVAGSIFATSTLVVDDTSHLVGNVDVNGMATVTAASGNIATEGTLTVGGDVSGTAIDRVFVGVCYLDEVLVTASSTTYAACSGAAGVTEGDRVLVQATSSLNAALYVQAASSSAIAGDISVLLYNTGYTAADTPTTSVTTIIDATAGTASFNFWAFR